MVHNDDGTYPMMYSERNIRVDVNPEMGRKVEGLIAGCGITSDGLFWWQLRNFWRELLEKLATASDLVKPDAKFVLDGRNGLVSVVLDTMASYLHLGGRNTLLKCLFFYMLGKGFFDGDAVLELPEPDDTEPISLESFYGLLRGHERIHPSVSELSGDELSSEVRIRPIERIHGMGLQILVLSDMIFRGKRADLFLAACTFQGEFEIHHTVVRHEKRPTGNKARHYYRKFVKRCVDSILDWIADRLPDGTRGNTEVCIYLREDDLHMFRRHWWRADFDVNPVKYRSGDLAAVESILRWSLNAEINRTCGGIVKNG